MLACRLCLAFSVQDPEQWLESCPKRVVSVWRAFAEAEGWFTERRLAAVTAVSLKRLLAIKYGEDSRLAVMKSVDSAANKYMPLDQQWAEETQAMDESVLQVMNRSGEVVSTPKFTTEIEVDPWQRP